MGSLFRALMRAPLLRSVLRPVTRVLIGAIAIPIFRFILRHVFRLQELDDELEKDLEQWFRGSLLLLAATANMEHLLFGWAIQWDWFTIGLRLLLAIGVVEAMPDQELFAVIHPGPPRLKPGRGMLREAWQRKREILKGMVCQHLNRSSPVLAIMAAIFGAQVSDAHFTKMEAELTQRNLVTLVRRMDPEEAAQQAAAHAKEEVERARAEAWEQFVVGWVCYGLAITQYLIMGLVTSRDRAMDVLSEFDRAVAERRRELVEEFQLDEQIERAARDQAEQAQREEEQRCLPPEQPPPSEPNTATSTDQESPATPAGATAAADSHAGNPTPESQGRPE